MGYGVVAQVLVGALISADELWGWAQKHCKVLDEDGDYEDVMDAYYAKAENVADALTEWLQSSKAEKKQLVAIVVQSHQEDDPKTPPPRFCITFRSLEQQTTKVELYGHDNCSSVFTSLNARALTAATEDPELVQAVSAALVALRIAAKPITAILSLSGS